MVTADKHRKKGNHYMAAHINVIGRLVRDPEQSVSKSGTTVTDFTVASNSKERDKNGESVPSFFSVRVFGRHAEVCAQYLKKGSQVFVKGEFLPVTYTTKEGEERTLYTIARADVEFLGSSANASNHGAQPTQNYKPGKKQDSDYVVVTSNEDDLPF